MGEYFEELQYRGSFRLIIHDKMNGRYNMAVDESLLEGMKGGEQQPVIRLYGFSPPTLSLGRFQKTGGLLDYVKIEEDGITLVRRPTGGQAVLHDDELTYSVIMARTHIEPFRKRVIYNFIAKLLLQGLKLLGVPARINRVLKGDLHQPNCFATSGEYELVSDEQSGSRKLIGSAQVTTREGVLQHGAIPIGDSYRNIRRYLMPKGIDSPEDERINEKATCIEEITGKIVSFERCRKIFAEAIISSLPVEISNLTEEEKRRADALLAEKYSTDKWNL